MPRLKIDDRLLKEPQRAARWVQEHLPEAPRDWGRTAERGGREAVRWVQEHVSDLRRSGRDAGKALRLRAPSRRELELIAKRADPPSLVWPTLLAAAGAGAAFWWWTQWSRGRAEAEAAERDARGGAKGAADPAAVMAHAPSPPDVEPPSNRAEDGLGVPAEQVMAHAPPPPGKPKGKLKKVDAVVAPKAREALQRNLAVQAAGDAPPLRKPKGKGGEKAAP